MKLILDKGCILPSNSKASSNVLNRISPMCLFILISKVYIPGLSAGVPINSWDIYKHLFPNYSSMSDIDIYRYCAIPLWWVGKPIQNFLHRGL